MKASNDGSLFWTMVSCAKPESTTTAAARKMNGLQMYIQPDHRGLPRRDNTGKRIPPRIQGLDPRIPCFAHNPATVRRKAPH